MTACRNRSASCDRPFHTHNENIGANENEGLSGLDLTGDRRFNQFVEGDFPF